jgi:hypothetical protein
MLRTFAAAVCVLLLAGLVAGGLYLLVGQGGGSQERRSYGSPDAGSDYRRSGHGRGGRWEGGPPEQRERRGREEASVGRGAGGMLVTAVQTGFVAAAVVGVQTYSRRRRKASFRNRTQPRQ